MAQRRMSKREARDERRFRIEQERLRERQRRARQNLLVIGGSILLGALIIGLVFLSIARRGGSNAPAATPSTVLNASTAPPKTPATLRATTSPVTSGSPVK